MTRWVQRSSSKSYFFSTNRKEKLSFLVLVLLNLIATLFYIPTWDKLYRAVYPVWDLLATEQQTHTGGGGGGGGAGTHRCSDSCCPLPRQRGGVRCSYNTDPCDPTHPVSRTSVAANPPVGVHICGCWVLFISSLIFLPWNKRTGGEKNQAAGKSPQAEKTKRKRTAAVRRLEFQSRTSILKTHTTRVFFNPFKKLISVLWGERGRSYS